MKPKPIAAAGMLVTRRGDGEEIPTRVWVKALLPVGVALVLLAGLGFWLWRSHTAEQRRIGVAENLRRIGLAFEEYAAEHKRLPAPASTAPGRASGLSWRVHLLPHLGLRALHSQFRLGEPWDSPHNKRLVEQMPAVYRDARLPDLAPGETTLLLAAGPATLFAGGAPRASDAGPQTAIALFAGSTVVPWTKPEDLPFEPGQAKTLVFGKLAGQCPVLCADFTVRWLPAQADDAALATHFSPSAADDSLTLQPFTFPTR